MYINKYILIRHNFIFNLYNLSLVKNIIIFLYDFIIIK